MLTDKRNVICGCYCILANYYFYIHKSGSKFSHWSAVCSLRKFRAKCRWAALGWAIMSGTLCRNCIADGSADIQTFGVNNVQNASVIQFSARRISGCSRILQTMMSSLTATERDNGRLTTGDSPNVVANAFGVYSNIISHLWHRFQATGTTRVAWGRRMRFWGRNLQWVCSWTFLVIEN